MWFCFYSPRGRAIGNIFQNNNATNATLVSPSNHKQLECSANGLCDRSTGQCKCNVVSDLSHLACALNIFVDTFIQSHTYKYWRALREPTAGVWSVLVPRDALAGEDAYLCGDWHSMTKSFSDISHIIVSWIDAFVNEGWLYDWIVTLLMQVQQCTASLDEHGGIRAPVQWLHLGRRLWPYVPLRLRLEGLLSNFIFICTIRIDHESYLCIPVNKGWSGP